MSQISNLSKKTIEAAKRIAIFGHMSPDGDCIGAMLGLGRLLEKQKKQVSYFVPNKPSKIFNFIKEIKKLKTNCDYKKYDLLIFVDFTGISRIGTLSKYNPEYFSELPLIIFDHHIGESPEHGIIVKDVKSISTCEILFEYTYKWWPELYDNDIATKFYLGITADSGNLLFEDDHIRTFTNMLKLLKLGADKDFVVNNLMRKKSLNAIRFLQLLLNRIKQQGGILYTYYDEIELEDYDIDQEEAAYGLHVIQNIDGPDMVLLIRKVGDMLRGSIRAKQHHNKNIDCNKIAKVLGGGGHKLAAGFSVITQGKFVQQVDKIVKYINTLL